MENCIPAALTDFQNRSEAGSLISERISEKDGEIDVVQSEQRERTEFSPPVESSPLLPKEIKALLQEKRGGKGEKILE